MMTLQEYYDAVVATFERWIAQHFDEDTWIRENTLDDDIQYTFDCSGGVLDNPHVGFYFNWKDAAYKYTAKQVYGVRCTECGQLDAFEYGEHVEECECGTDEYQEDLSDDEIAEWLSEVEWPVSEWDLERAMPEAFQVYSEALENTWGDMCATVKEGYIRLVEYDDVQDLMAALLYVTTVYHSGGVLLEDHGEDYLDPALVDDVRENGLQSIWDREEIAEFMQAMEK